ncbi:HAMP domain-containing sensor histidine kinase [Clostridium hydrogeniformans]|uniref:HAMP domain-containing sensor histidine kinase n=1 Tax=Clostridium hydrogeniformans TaxID=349933 RepID=UPI00068CD38F|nr:HAMP domain-containing sensor histidine kinase [Clostridium hydrogeniformans]
MSIFNRNKKSKLSNLLFRNYILSYLITTFILMITAFILIIIAAYLYMDDEYLVDNASTYMKDDYTQIDISKLVEKGGYMDIVNDKGDVIYSKGSRPNDKTNYSTKDFSIVFSSNYYDGFDSKYIYKTEYNEDKNFLLVIGIPKDQQSPIIKPKRRMKPRSFVIFSLTLSLLVFLISFIIYSKTSSRAFIKPLKALMEGVKRVSNGDYSTRIYLKSNNEFGELRDAFNTMAEKIEEQERLNIKSEEMRRRLILDISHDLKNPLSSILGYSDLLLKQNDLSSEEIDRYLLIINNNSIRANGLIQDLFDFSKLQSNDFKLTFNKVDMCEFLREIIAEYIPELEEKGFTYDFDIPEESVYLQVDEKHLMRAFRNIISNSLKYNPPGTSLLIRAYKSENKFLVKIKDNGIGIPKELKEDIFQPFTRVDSSRNSKSGGSGLGLTITKDIIEKHNGTIGLNCDTNKGSEFTIYFSII